MTMVVEGIRTCDAAFKYAKKHHLELPIIEQIHHVLFDKMDPEIAYKNLLARTRKSEG